MLTQKGNYQNIRIEVFAVMYFFENGFHWEILVQNIILTIPDFRLSNIFSISFEYYVDFWLNI